MMSNRFDPQTPTPHADRLRSARGATLTGYALTMALIAVASLAAINLLTTSGGQLLTDVSLDISTPRPYESVLVETPLTPPPAWASTTVPPGIITWVERALATPEGCLNASGSDLLIVPCTNPNATLFNGLSEDGTVVFIGLVDGSMCLTGDDSGVGPPVSLQPCGVGSQEWTEEFNAGDFISYRHDASGLCLQAEVPATPAALTLAPCDGSTIQQVEVQF